MSKLPNTTHVKNETPFHLNSWDEAFSSLDVGISVISKDLQLEYINDAYRKLIGIPPHIKPKCAALDIYLLIAERGDMGPGDPRALAEARLAELQQGGSPEIIQNSVPGNICKVDRKIITNGYILTSVTDITKNATSEAMLSSIIHSADHGIMITNHQGVVEFYNNTFADMFVGIAIPQNDNPTFFDYFYEAWKSGKLAGDFYGAKMSTLSEEEFLANTNQFCGASMNAPQKIRLSGGKHLSFTSELLDGNRKLLSFKDTTEKVLHEVEVNQAQQRSEDALNDFRVAFDNMDVGLVLLDKNLKVLLINDAFHGIWNTNSADIHTGKDFRTLIDINRKNGIYDVQDENWEDYVSGRLLEIKAGPILPREFERADGKILVYSCTALSDGQRLVKYSDITEFKNRENALEQAQMSAENMLTDFSAAINNMDVGLVLVDKDLNTLLINDAFHEIWNTNAGNFKLGQSFRTLMDINRTNGIYDVLDEDWEDYVQMRMDEIRSGSIASREFVRADGKVLIYSNTELSGGQRLISYTNITEFKQREEELEKAQLLAESADRSKSEFLANMSHEIRTPMNGVMGMAELLGKTQLDSKQKMFTDVILSSSTALLTIINDILDFSKIEAGKLELELAPFCLSAVIEDIATLVATGVVEKNLELIVRLQPGLANNLIGDAGRFRQILTNLIGNAVKFTEKGHVLVDVSGHEENGVVSLKCSVKDTGIGIPEEQLDTVFEKFSQVDASSTRRHEGTGLGLAITTRLIDLMEGEVGCQSVLGEGSTFWFSVSLPVDKNALPIISTSVNVAGARALAIDDNSVNRSILLEQFGAWDLAGQAAASGLEGLAMLRNAMGNEEPYEVVILDFHMPDMNGLEVARVIRSDEKLKKTPIVMLTSVDNIAEGEDFRSLNIDAHLTKPARASQLLESIVNVLRKPLENVKSKHIPASESTPALVSETGEQPPLFGAQDQSEQEQPRSVIEIEKGIVENEPLAPYTPADTFESTSPPLPAQDTLIRDNPPQPAAPDEGSSDIKILVAEDNEVNQLVFTQILEYMNFDFKIVENGKLAVETALKSRPKIILMDVSMPVMNGLDAAREIRKLCASLSGVDAYKPIIIAVTAHALKDDKEKCFAAGMDDYMSKPISPDMLIKKIKEWVPEFEEKPEQLRVEM